MIIYYSVLMDILENFLSLNYMGQSNISLGKAVLLFYLIIASNFTTDLYSSQLYDFLKNNRYSKHGIGFLIMTIIIIHIAGITDPQKAITYSILGYIWFVFTTKLDLHWNLAIIGLMVVGALYESTMADKEIKSDDDEALETEDKNKIKLKHNKIKSYLVIATILVTLLGTLSYLNKKKIQYGGDFDATKFILKGGSRYD